jgi:saccharopine dehydrogenase-like NADP-dependent oxidoreductase
MPNRAILVTGATGKQGGAVINTLLSSGAIDITILALTRDAKSPAAIKLEERGIKIVQGDFNDISNIFANIKKVLGEQPLWGVYSVQVSLKISIEKLSC